MGTHERRMAIWNTLCQRKQDTAGHLAAEFHVSLRTIYYDLEYLSLIYPLEVIRGRYHGGIKIADYFTPDKTKLTPVQRNLLLRLCANLYGRQRLPTQNDGGAVIYAVPPYSFTEEGKRLSAFRRFRHFPTIRKRTNEKSPRIPSRMYTLSMANFYESW